MWALGGAQPAHQCAPHSHLRKPLIACFSLWPGPLGLLCGIKQHLLVRGEVHDGLAICGVGDEGHPHFGAEEKALLVRSHKQSLKLMLMNYQRGVHDNSCHSLQLFHFGAHFPNQKFP